MSSALRNAPAGTYGDRTYMSIAVPASRARIVVSVPTKALYAPVDGAARTTMWETFGAFVLALLALLAIGATALRRSARLAHARLHDALTGLPNRALFLDRTERPLMRLDGEQGQVGVLFVDLDHFKLVNDTLGHSGGDSLLERVAERMQGSVRAADTVGRLGGDEFVVLCERLADRDKAYEVAARIQQALAEPFAIDGHEISIGCSIGIALESDGERGVSSLIDEADLAMYQAKRHGRNRIEYFTSTTSNAFHGSERPPVLAVQPT